MAEGRARNACVGAAGPGSQLAISTALACTYLAVTALPNHGGELKVGDADSLLLDAQDSLDFCDPSHQVDLVGSLEKIVSPVRVEEPKGIHALRVLLPCRQRAAHELDDPLWFLAGVKIRLFYPVAL